MINLINSILVIASAIVYKFFVGHTSDSLDLRFGTMTPYRFVANTHDFPVNFTGCEPTKMVMVLRHGTRSPKSEFVVEMNDFLAKLRDHIQKGFANLHDSKAVQLLSEWKPTFDSRNDQVLEREGKIEMFHIAQRTKKRFPSILTSRTDSIDDFFQVILRPHLLFLPYNSPFFKKHKFKYTDTQRTRQSALYFAKGLRENELLIDDDGPLTAHFTESQTNSTSILRFYKYCEKWKQNVKKNKNAFEELTQFRQSSEMVNLIQIVSNDLNYSLSYDDVRVIYKACAFETAVRNDYLSPWCLLIKPNLMKALEYTQDLQHYWVDGYGYELTHNQACVLMQNIVDLLTNENKQRGIFYFTHSGAMLKLIAHLGLYKEKAIRNEGFGKNDQRMWKTSKIGPFASNLAFIRYRCKDDDKSNDEQQKVLIMHNEKMVELRQLVPVAAHKCHNSDNNDCYLDNFERFSRKYSKTVDCKFNEMCKI